MKSCVLVVEDDESLRDTVCELLADEGFTAQSRGNGKEALDWLNANEVPCVILLDLMMPVMNGWDFLAARAKDPRLAPIPVVVMSASHAGVTQVTATLPKPVKIEDLVETLARYC